MPPTPHYPINVPNRIYSWLFSPSVLAKENKTKTRSQGWGCQAWSGEELLLQFILPDVLFVCWKIDGESLRVAKSWFCYTWALPLVKGKFCPAAPGSAVFAWPVAGQADVHTSSGFLAGRKWMNPVVLGLKGLHHYCLRPAIYWGDVVPHGYQMMWFKKK